MCSIYAFSGLIKCLYATVAELKFLPKTVCIYVVPFVNNKTINNPDASVGVCCSHKVVAVGFNTLRYDASVGVLNPPHE